MMEEIYVAFGKNTSQRILCVILPPPPICLYTLDKILIRQKFTDAIFGHIISVGIWNHRLFRFLKP